MSVLGKLPSRTDFVHCGLLDEPERVFRAWLEQAVLIAGGVLPNRAVRFVVAPRRTPMLGIWVPSQDALGRAFPLVFLRRLSSSAGNGRASGSNEPRALGDLPWTLILAGCAHYLSAAESCLLLGRSNSAANLWKKLEALPLPSHRDLAGLWAEANRALESEQLDTFAARNLSEAACGDAFLSAVRRLGPTLSARVTGECAASQDDGSMLALPAAHEFDVFAWLELLRVQRAPGLTPRSLFWSPADRRALVSLGAPLPGTLAFLRQPRVKSVQRLPIVNEPDESPAIENELRRLVQRCVTLAKLRSALSGDRQEAGKPPPLPKKDGPPVSHANQSPASRAKQQPPAPAKDRPPTASSQQPLASVLIKAHDSWYDQEPPPLAKFQNVAAPRSHYPCGEYPPDKAKKVAQPSAATHPVARPANAPATEPLSGTFIPEQPSPRPETTAQRGRIRFRIPNPPVNLSDTDAIEYVCALVRERERAEEEYERAERRRERVEAELATTKQEDRDPEELRRKEELFVRERNRAWQERDRAKQKHADTQRLERDRHIADQEGALAHQKEVAAERAHADSKRSLVEAHDLRGTEQTSLDPRQQLRSAQLADVDLALQEQLVERELSFARRERGVLERERDVRRREIALHSRERQLRELERTVRHGERVRRISQTVEIDHPLASVRVLEPITIVQGRSTAVARGVTHEPARPSTLGAAEPPPHSPLLAAHARSPVSLAHERSSVRTLEPITIVDDGSIRAARVLMIE